MTSFGGLSLISAFFEKIGLSAFLNSAFPIVETSNRKIPLYSLGMRIKKAKKAKVLSKRCRYRIVKKCEKSGKVHNNDQIFF